MRGSRSHVRQRLAGLLLGMGLLLAGCDVGGGFDLGESGAQAPDQQLASEDATAPGEEPGGPQEEPAGPQDEEPAASEGAAGPGGTGSPMEGTDGFFVPPSQAADWVAANPDDPRADAIRERIAQVPASVWLTGGAGVDETVDSTVAAAAADNRSVGARPG